MKTIFLSAGHGGKDPGVVAFGRKEADIAVEFRNLVSFYLMRAGITHALDGHGTENLPLKDAIREAQGFDIKLEFHCNGFHNRSATGAEVLSAARDKVLAADISKALANALTVTNRGAKAENAGQHHRLAFVQAGGLVVEMFFLTNPSDLAKYDERKWLAARDMSEVLIEVARR